MFRFIQLLVMAFRYFKLHFKRYLFLLGALSFGFGVITVLSSQKEGMERNLKLTAQAHYAGDIVIQGDDDSQLYHIPAPQEMEVLLSKEDVGIEHKVQRTILGSGLLFYNGNSASLKYVIGVDWQREEEYFKNLSYEQRSPVPFSEEGILISAPMALKLQARLGDSLVLQVLTKTGQVNTGRFIIQGIVRDKSIFGYYKCYLSRKALNRLILYKEDESSHLGITLSRGQALDDAAFRIHRLLSSRYDMAALVSNRDELSLEQSCSWEGIRYFIITLDVYLSEVAELLRAIELLSYFLYVLMILIIVVSILVTYRLVLHERERELSTMQVLVFSRGEVMLMLVLEAIFLYILSIILGFLLGMFMNQVGGYISFDWFPSFEIFMKDGRLVPSYSFRSFLMNCGIILAALLPSVIWPVYKAAGRPLAAVLSGGSK